jgi:hypothetical protein
MKRILTVTVLCITVTGLMIAGCGAKKADSSSQAINEAKAMQTTQEKVDYLVGQAKAFYNSKEFQGSIDIAQYILRYLDKDSQAAKDLIQKAKDQLTAQAQSMVDEAKKGLSGFGK